jgi:hypothetical protein
VRRNWLGNTDRHGQPKNQAGICSISYRQVKKPFPYLNDFHRERSERLKEQLAKQPKATLEQVMEQYDRIKKGSSRRSPAGKRMIKSAKHALAFAEGKGLHGCKVHVSRQNKAN